MQKNSSLSIVGPYFFFFSVLWPTIFIFKQMVSARLWGQNFLKQQLRFRISVGAINFYDFTFFRNSSCSHGTVGRTTGFWFARFGLKFSLDLHFVTLLLRLKIVIPPLMHDKFRYQNFSETPNFCPLRIFSALWDKKISTKNRDIPLFCIKHRNQFWWKWWK